VLVISAWETCAGPLLARQTKAVGFSDKRLTVAVKDETWQKHLIDLTPQLLAKLNRSVGDGTVTFIDLVVDPKFEGHNVDADTQIEGSIELHNVSKPIAAASETIDDESLKESYLNFVERMDNLRKNRK
jgi:hypothetical protein